MLLQIVVDGYLALDLFRFSYQIRMYTIVNSSQLLCLVPSVILVAPSLVVVFLVCSSLCSLLSLRQRVVSATVQVGPLVL